MGKCYMEISYSKREWSFPKIAIVAIEAEDGRLISECAEIAKKKLEETIGEKVEMLDFSYLGSNVVIID